MNSVPSTKHKVVIAVSLFLAVLFLYPRQGGPDASNAAVLNDFSTVDGRIFSEKERDQKPFLEFESLGDTFVIHENPHEPHPVLRHSLHARLTGPHGQHFSCFLARTANGTHHCLTTSGLEPGDWNVNITLVRSPVKKQLPQCTPASSLTSSGSTTFSVVDYILAGDFPTFKTFLNCFDYPYTRVLEEKWTKTASAAIDNEEEENENDYADDNKKKDIKENEEICKGPGGPGTWISHTKPCAASNLCQGSISDDIFNHKSNIQRGIQHIFKPFTCRPHLFEKPDARSCALANSITLAGDSRTLHLVTGFQQWLGQDAVQFIPLYRPYRLGLTHAWTQPSGDQLRKAIRSGDAILINSVLHDVAEFYSTTTAEDVMKAWSTYVDCSSKECIGKLALECGCRKQWAVKAYLHSIDLLRDDIIAARKEAKEQKTPEPRVYWVSLHKRPPSPPDIFYDWQTADVVRELEDRASFELGKAGVEHIDLRWMTGAAPGQWWDDPVHFGKEKKSLFLHSTLHAILSQVCSSDSGSLDK